MITPNHCEVQPDIVRTFFETVYLAKPPDHFIWVGSFDPYRGNFYREIDTSVDAVTALNRNGLVDTYCSTISYARRPKSGRGHENDCGAVLAAHADFDIASPIHTKKGCFRDLDQCLLVANAIGIKPTITVATGNGAQAWWLLRNPILTSTKEDRTKAKLLVGTLWAAVATKAAALSRQIDPTRDLARVLRVGGSVNVKDHDNPKQTSIIEINQDALYGEEDFKSLKVREDFMKKILYGAKRESCEIEITSDEIALLPNEQVKEYVLALIDVSPEFEHLWNRRPLNNTKDDGTPDDSASGYLWRIMLLLDAREVDESLIYSICYYWRCKHKEQPKKMGRIDTFKKELANARKYLDQKGI